VPGHNPMALNAKGVPQPAVAGVLFANAGPGTASDDNLVQGNHIAGNGLSGVTMHAHTIAKGQFPCPGRRALGVRPSLT
jgi:hypothetical protein